MFCFCCLRKGWFPPLTNSGAPVLCMHGEKEEFECDVALEERDIGTKDLMRSKLYYPQSMDVSIELPFKYGTLKEYEVAHMLLGRHLLKLSGMSVVPGSTAASSSSERVLGARRTLVVFPGAGAWFGVVNGSVALRNAGSSYEGTWMQWIRWCTKTETNCVLLNPQTLMYEAKEKAYKLHVDSVMPKILERFGPTTKEWVLLGYSLGGVNCIRAWRKFFQGGASTFDKCRIALIDSICHGDDDLRGGKYEKLLDLPSCHHWACRVPRNDGLPTSYCGTDDHGDAVSASFPLIVEWIESRGDGGCILF